MWEVWSDVPGVSWGPLARGHFPMYASPVRASHGRHCRSTLSLTVIGLICLGIRTVIILAVIAVSFCQNESVAPGYRLPRPPVAGSL
jgi:hypothetical protein